MVEASWRGGSIVRGAKAREVRAAGVVVRRVVGGEERAAVEGGRVRAAGQVAAGRSDESTAPHHKP